MRLHYAPPLETTLNTRDQRSLVRERFGTGHRALHALAMRGCEDLFGRNVRNARQSIARSRAAAHPYVVISQADAQIGARPAEVQGTVSPVVQQGGTLAKFIVMRAPRRHRIW